MKGLFKTETMKKKENFERFILLEKIKHTQDAIRTIGRTNDFLIETYLRDFRKFKHGDTVKRKGRGEKDTYRIYGCYFTTENTIGYDAIGNSSKEHFDEDEIRLVNK